MRNVHRYRFLITQRDRSADSSNSRIARDFERVVLAAQSSINRKIQSNQAWYRLRVSGSQWHIPPYPVILKYLLWVLVSLTFETHDLCQPSLQHQPMLSHAMVSGAGQHVPMAGQTVRGNCSPLPPQINPNDMHCLSSA